LQRFSEPVRTPQTHHGNREHAQREKITGRMLALDRAFQEAMPYLFALLGVHDGEGPLDETDSAVRQRRTRDAIRTCY
jgi:hypothetical protein